MSLFNLFSRHARDSVSDKHMHNVQAFPDIWASIESEYTPGPAPELIFNLSTVRIQENLAHVIHHDYVHHCLTEKKLGLHAPIVNEFAHSLIYDNEHRLQASNPLPDFFPLLMQYLADEEISKQRFLAMMRKSTAMRDAVIRSTRCKVYNASLQACDNFERACVMLSLADLKKIACSVALASVFEANDSTVTQQVFWPQAIRTGLIAQQLCSYIEQSFAVFMAGLFCGVGKVHFVEQLQKDVRLLCNEETYNFLDQQYFERLTLALMADWQLPENVLARVRDAAITPMQFGLVADVIAMSNCLAELVYLYEHNIWDEAKMDLALQSSQISREQLNVVIDLASDYQYCAAGL
jgi:HD-like signal output (HDOD) protein